jgi:hypothetical protein
MSFFSVGSEIVLSFEDEAKLLDFSELPKSHDNRIRRFVYHKRRNEDFSNYLLSRPDLTDSERVKFSNLKRCSSFLLFVHALISDVVRLSGGNFCRMHLLCPMCAIRRAAKKIRTYYEKYVRLKRENPDLRLSYAVLTVVNGESLDERYSHLELSVRKLLQHRRDSRLYHKGRKKYDYAKDCSLRSVVGGAYSFEVKRGSGSHLWHPHANFLMLSEGSINADDLSLDWRSITKDSHIVYVKDKSFIGDDTLSKDEDEKQVFVEIFKYALKFSELNFEDNYEAYKRLSGRRLVGTFGAFYNLSVDDDVEDIGDEPYIQLIYRWLDGQYKREI